MYNKLGNIKLETTAHYQNPIDTKLKFYNTDTGTAQLVFHITRNNFPLEISSKNTHSFIILKTNDEHYVVDDLEYIDPLNGVVAYTIPNDFLAKPGEVKGQLYINVRGTEDVITEVDFNFVIEDAVINTIPVIDKVKIIRTFAELQKNVQVTIDEIKERLTDGERTVNQIKAVLNDGLSQINNAKDVATDQLNNLKQSALNELSSQKENYINEINQTSSQAVQNVQALTPTSTSQWQKSKLTNDNGTLPQISNLDFNSPDTILGDKTQMLYVSNAINHPGVANGTLFQEVVTTNYKRLTFKPNGQNNVFIKSKDNGVWSGWQQLSTEESKNKAKTIGTLGTGEYTDILTLKAGVYDCIIPSDYRSVNAPNVGSSLPYVANISVYEGSSGRKKINLVKVSDNTEYRTTVDTDGRFKGWKKVYSYPDNQEVFNDTGWIDWQLENGTIDRSMTTGEGSLFKNQYRIIKIFGVTYGYIRFNITNITDRTIVGRIPAKMVPKAQTGLLRTGLSQFPITFTIDIEGNILVYVNANDKSSWQPEGYAIGEYEWIIDNEYFDAQAPTYIEGESPEDLNIAIENDSIDNITIDADGDELLIDDELSDASLSDVLPDYGEVLDQPNEEVE
ncbi:BppU family phage baseplate upper protein [Staphylococcus chromogenes]